METVDLTIKQTSIILASIKVIYFGKRFDGQLMRCKIKNTFLPCLNSNVCFIILTNQTMRCSLVCKFIVNSFIFWYHCKHIFL